MQMKKINILHLLVRLVWILLFLALFRHLWLLASASTGAGDRRHRLVCLWGGPFVLTDTAALIRVLRPWGWGPP